MTSKISDDLFLVIGRLLSVFCLFFYCKSDNMHPYNMTLFLPKNLYFRTKHSFMTPFLSQFVLCNTSNNIILLEILGDGCMGRPPASDCFLGDLSPVSPKFPPMITTIHCYKLRFSKICKNREVMPMVDAPNLKALATQFFRNGLEEIWSPYL